MEEERNSSSTYKVWNSIYPACTQPGIGCFTRLGVSSTVGHKLYCDFSFRLDMSMTLQWLTILINDSYSSIIDAFAHLGFVFDVCRYLPSLGVSSTIENNGIANASQTLTLGVQGPVRPFHSER